MSTPTTSTGPTPPGPTSNPVALRGWFQAIIDWIKALSPAGATAHDTGWVPCTVDGAGWTNVSAEPVMIRRVGKQVYMRGVAHNNTLAKGTSVTMGSVPAGFRPSQRSAFSGSLNTAQNLFIRIETNGNITAGWWTDSSSTTTGSWWGFNNVTYLID